MIEAKKLTKHFGSVTAVNALDLKIEGGEIFCLLGPNGAGKTTTISIFLNFITPSSGEALIDGIDVTRRPFDARRRLAYIPEQVMLYPLLTGLENLAYFRALSGERQASDEELLGWLKEAGLPEEAATRRLGTYSKGMRQKVGIAIARARRVKVLLLDEPTSGLDPSAAYEFSELLKRLAGEGLAVLVATHDLFRAEAAATRIGIMNGGELVASFSRGEVGHRELEQVYLGYVQPEQVAPV